MSPSTRRRLAWAAVGLEVALSLGALGGGVLFVLDPTGGRMGMTLQELSGTPFSDYRQAGWLLLLVHGAGPWVAVAAEATKARWAGLAHVAVAGALLVWMAFQGATMGLHAPVQFVMIAQGVAMAAVAIPLAWADRAAGGRAV